MDEESGLVLFVNKAAKKFNFNKNENINSRGGRKGANIENYYDGFDYKEELFAPLDMNLLRESCVDDSKKIISRI